MNNNILRVGIMCRVSTEEQALHGDSLAAQETALVEHAKANNMKIYKIYRDEGYSARKPVLKRPAMIELLEDVKAGKMDMVIFTKLDRWFRNVGEYHKIQEILETNRVVWKAILEDYNTATADGRLKVNIMLSVAENEADRTSERIKFVFQSKVMRKEVIVPDHCIPMGYKAVVIDGVKRVIKDEETREATEFFFNAVLTSTIRQAALQTNKKLGILKDYKSYYNMCRNQLYTGTYKDVENYCEPYITKQHFEQLQNIKQYRQAQKHRVYLFTGLIRCPLCGRRMVSKSCVGNGGIEHLYYRCSNAITKKCSTKTVSEKLVERYVLENIKTELENFILSHEVEQPKKQNKKSDAEKLKERLRRINVSYQAGNMEDDEYLAETKEIKAMIEKAVKEENADTTVDTRALKEFLNSGFERIYVSLDKEEKQKLWRSVIDELIYDGQNIVGIKFKA